MRDYWIRHAPLKNRQPLQTVETLATRLHHNVYHVFDGTRDYVIKHRTDRNPGPLLQEFEVLRGLAPLNVAPMPYAIDVRAEMELSPCLIMQYMSGRLLQKGDLTPPLTLLLGQTCARIHSVPIESLPPLTDVAYADLLSYAQHVIGHYHSFLDRRARNDQLAAEMRRLATQVERVADSDNHLWQDGAVHVLCHGDLREFNMVLQGDRLAMLDWERCCIDDPAYDIAWLLTLSKLDVDQLRLGYGEGDGRFWERVAAYRAVHTVTWPIHLLQIAEAGDAEIADMYERDAYDALARALGGSHNAESVRALGPLLVNK